MSEVREPGFDRIVALVLRIGAFSCFFVMLAGLIVGCSSAATFLSASSAPASC